MAGLRILHVLDHSIPLHSGYTFRTRAILEQQRRLGWQTFQLTGPKHEEGGEALEETVDGLHFFRTPAGRGPARNLPLLRQWTVVRRLARRMEEVVAEVRPQLIHAHSPALNGMAAAGVARRRGLPLVYEVRAFWEDAAVDHGTSREGGPRYRASRRLETHVLRRAGAVTTICEGLRGEIVARGIPAGRVTVVPNAVDVAGFRSGGTPDAALARALGLEDRLVIGFIGSFYRYEGLHLLLEAMPRLAGGPSGVKLVLVGGGFQDAELRAQAARLGIDDEVVFTGRVPHAEVGRYYDLVDVFVYPRTSCRLTELVTPLKPLEAMAQGRLVLASDVGGHRELIRDSETGWLFPAGDPEALAAGLARVQAERERWPQVREAARRYVEEARNWPASVARYRDVYQALVGTEAAGA